MGRSSRYAHRSLKRLTSWFRGRGGRALGTALLVLPAVGYIAYRMVQNWGQVRASTWTFRPAYGALALLGYFLALSGVLWAWNRIVGQLTPFRRFAQNARLYCLSNLSRHIPGAVWYMAGRTFLYGQVGVPASRTLAGIALEVLLTITAGLLTYLLSLPLAGSLGAAPLRLGLALGLLVPALLFLQPPLFNRILAFFLRRLGSREEVRITYRGLFPVLLIYVLTWVFGGATLYALIRSIYNPLPWTELPAVVGIWAAAGTIGLLASTFLLGLGVREVALSTLLLALLPEERAIAAAVLFWFLLTAGDLITAGLALLFSRRGETAPGSSAGAPAEISANRPPAQPLGQEEVGPEEVTPGAQGNQVP